MPATLALGHDEDAGVAAELVMLPWKAWWSVPGAAVDAHVDAMDARAHRHCERPPISRGALHAHGAPLYEVASDFE